MQPEKPEEDNYPYLAKYSPLIVHMQRVLGGAYLHEKFYNHLKQVFEQQPPLRTLVQELDRILTSLVTDFDAVEQPLRAAATNSSRSIPTSAAPSAVTAPSLSYSR